MPENYYGIVEMTLVFSLVLGFCVWQLYSIEKTREKLRRAQPPEQSRPRDDADPSD
jgi:hypothetical protein